MTCTTGVEELKEILRIYTGADNKKILREIAPFATLFSLVIYAILLIQDGHHFLIFLILGFGLGAFYFNKAESKLKIEEYERNLNFLEQQEQFSNTYEPEQSIELYYPPLTTVINQLLDYVMRDFIASWWTPLNEYKDPTFEKVARERLNIVCLNLQKILLNQERNDIVMSTLYGVANTLIIHMRECRAFEDSKLTIEEYVLSNPQSPFAQLLSKEKQHKQLRGLSHLFLKKTLPTPDRDSHLLMSLFTELLAIFVFGNVLDSLSDPDFLNCWIIDFLSDKEKTVTIASTLSDTILKEELNKNNIPSRLSEEFTNEDCSIITVNNNGVIQKSTTLEDNNINNIEQPTTPTDTFQLNRKPTPIITAVEKNHEITLLASLQSPPSHVLQSPLGPPMMIFQPGSVNFTIMDISAPQSNGQFINKSELIYLVQIERPAMEDHASSEGGGYVITRTYSDFEGFNTILYARHTKRATKLQLKLPLDIAFKSWLKKSSSYQQKKKMPLDKISEELEKYIHLVVEDNELGTDPIILSFLRKETRSDIAEDGGGRVVSFSEEFKDEVAMAHSFLTTNTSKSLFSRNSSSSTLNNLITSNSVESFHTKIDNHSSITSGGERVSIDQESPKWFAPKAKSRKDSISSIQSNLSKDTSSITTREESDNGQSEDNVVGLSIHYLELEQEGEEKEKVKKPQKATITKHKDNHTFSNNNKALSSMDVELLIETTYALIIEIFNLTSSNNKAWMRRSILNLLREIVRRSYSEFISEQYTDFVNEYMSSDAIVHVLNQLGEKFWPEGKWILDGKEQMKRTDEDKEKSKQQARDLLMTGLIPNAVRQLIGDQNCNKAMDRIWARCQDPDLNRVLILQLLERIIKPILG
ncbi:PXA domain-containing protein [Cokeromyces recurvatus]|uniref:PXA domain-containing protein n=1 Tax=Cokeromyces recurvatus TaxID=90255 RepID=UPI002220D0B6|nr:PXA domain-containing protein [Cokeromyces recurvatus]KAI7901207.1 PXA domain-containing protein [Cokeromyces recurvatus]